MTFRAIIQICVILLSLVRIACGQGLNMNFELASVFVPPTPVGGSGGMIDPALAFPGWTVSNADVFYNDYCLGCPAASLIGPLYPNATEMISLEGSYSALLQYFGDSFYPDAPSLSTFAAIPTGTRSITFRTAGASENAQVTLDGTPVPLVALSSGLVGGEVAGFAGRSAQVTFSIGYGRFLFDDVRFSPIPVPEPSSFALACIGIVTLLLARARRPSQT